MSKPEKDESAKKPTYRVPPDGPWASAWKIAAIVAAIGLGTALLGRMSDPHRFAFSWLFAFMTFLAIGLGGLFVVLMQHLTGAGWGVTMRRSSELLMSGLPVFAILFVPIALNLDTLYPWYSMEAHHGEEHGEAHEEAEEGSEPHGALGLGGAALAQEHEGNERDAEGGERDTAEGSNTPEETGAEPIPLWDLMPNAWPEGAQEELEGSPQEAEHHEVVGEKLGYFHAGGRASFFLGRAAVYFIAWILLSFGFFSWSTRQDKERGLELTKKMQRWAPLATFVFAFTLTFAAFDWIMSAEPSWYSTIFGVQYFAVSAVIGHTVIILFTMGMRRSGLLGEAINVEHYHDLGKILFGFVVFWAYISFSQFMLIWYAGIPEEATYYHLRWSGGGGFKLVSLALMVGHFVVPFFVLISRNLKRRLEVLAFACVWLFVMHIVEIYWLVMPYANQSATALTSLNVHWIDIACLFAVGGTYAAVVLWQTARVPLVPIGDPRLERALHFENA